MLRIKEKHGFYLLIIWLEPFSIIIKEKHLHMKIYGVALLLPVPYLFSGIQMIHSEMFEKKYTTRDTPHVRRISQNKAKSVHETMKPMLY